MGNSPAPLPRDKSFEENLFFNGILIDAVLLQSGYQKFGYSSVLWDGRRYDEIVFNRFAPCLPKLNAFPLLLYSTRKC